MTYQGENLCSKDRSISQLIFIAILPILVDSHIKRIDEKRVKDLENS